MSVLTLTRADLKPLCGIDPGDTSADAALDALIAAQLGVYEYALDPAILAASAVAASAGDAGLASTLILGVAEALAGEFLMQSARAAGATDDFHLGPLSVTASRTDSPAQMGMRLAAAGLARLAPFRRAGRRAAEDAAGGAPDGSTQTSMLAQTATGPSLFDGPFIGPFDGAFDGPDCGGLEGRP